MGAESKPISSSDVFLMLTKSFVSSHILLLRQFLRLRRADGTACDRQISQDAITYSNPADGVAHYVPEDD